MKSEIHQDDNGSVMILDDVYSEEIYQEILNSVLNLVDNDNLQTHDSIGTATSNGNYNSLRKGIHLDNFFHNKRGEFPYFKHHLKVMSQITKLTPSLPFIFRGIEKTNHDVSLLGVYGKGDEYIIHNDSCTYTTIFFLSDQHTFSGGDLIFDQMDLTIKFKKNRLIIFPSWAYHSVSRVDYPINFLPQKNDYRFSIATFYGIMF